MKGKKWSLNKIFWPQSKLYVIILFERTYELHFNQWPVGIKLILVSWSLSECRSCSIWFIRQWGSKQRSYDCACRRNFIIVFTKNNFWSKMMFSLWIVSLKFAQREECFYLAWENVILASSHRDKFSVVVQSCVEHWCELYFLVKCSSKNTAIRNNTIHSSNKFVLEKLPTCMNTVPL